jgi:SNF2 family DNA or RNA helicase
LGSLEVIDEREVPIRDAVEEARLVRDLATRLGLRPNEARVLNGEAAVHFTVKIRGWATTGSGAVAFTPAATLVPTAQSVAGELNLRFNTEHGKEASAESVVEAWGRGAGYVRLIDGGWGALPTEWLAQHGDALVRLLSERRDGEPIPAKLLPEVADICDSLGIGCPDYFARLREALHDVESIPAATLPGDLTAQLRPYQRTGVNWLAFLRDHRLGALLADDMGLGKTLQTMCVLDRGALIVCPTSVLSSWREQLARFRTSLRVSTYHGPQRVLDSSADVVLTSYAILRLDREKLSAVQWNTVVLDEAQTIRNPMSQVAQAAFNLTSIHSISLSGTPIENSVDDLWSQFHFLNRGLLGSYREFQDTYGAAIRAGDISVARTVHKRVAPFILRRLKRTVAKELPPKTEVVLECELDEAERSAYEAVLAGTKSEVLRLLDQGEGVFSILEVLLRLRQACCHRGLLPGHSAESSTKVDLLLESLKQSAEMGHRALVFSQWTSMLDRIEPHLESAGISFSRIDGSTEGREEIVQQFQSPEGPTVMLLSLKAGGLGITLTSADHVYIVDPWWNPAVEDQAADRAYRIGQENPVIVHRLVARGTIEERILELQQRKRAVMEAVVGGAGGEMALSRSELLDLLDAGR